MHRRVTRYTVSLFTLAALFGAGNAQATAAHNYTKGGAADSVKWQQGKQGRLHTGRLHMGRLHTG
jgi:hypothetical protein